MFFPLFLMLVSKINTQVLVLYATILKLNGRLIIKRYKELKRISVISDNIWYHLTWQMMLDIIMRVTFLTVQNKYPATRFIFQNFDKNGILIIKRYK